MTTTVQVGGAAGNSATLTMQMNFLLGSAELMPARAPGDVFAKVLKEKPLRDLPDRGAHRHGGHARAE